MSKGPVFETQCMMRSQAV